ncbi:MAG: LytTR family DNA-binding domain-containing protein [Alphaproteobacteria bacterium]|nr:LytTR family DNA-binding domain-containing protein [Alphaproteobacteria bacterium]
MTTGDENGTNGTPRGEWMIGPWATIALVGIVVAFVNATSGIIEHAGGHWAAPVLWEGTSFLSVVAMAPAVGWAVQRWPFRRETIAKAALIHFGLTIPFALIHIMIIFVTREAAYWSVGARYGFFDDGVAITMLYEWRKDALVYAAFAATYAIFQRRLDQRASAEPADPRIEIRDGGSAVFLAPADIFFVEAAGNYIEFHTATRTHLVRGTLSAWEARLTARGFIRVHRSRLVNRAKITALKPTPSGDMEITLGEGRTVLGSRRYRAVLASGPAA